MTVEKAKQVLTGIGLDLASVGAWLVGFLPQVQTITGIAIGIVVLLINIERYKRIRRNNAKDNFSDHSDLDSDSSD